MWNFFRRQKSTCPNDRVYQFEIEQLESRILLSANFGFDVASGELTLSDFDSSSTFIANEVQFAETAPGVFQISLSEGVWEGTNSGVVSGAGTSVLTLDNTGDSISSIRSRSTTSDSFDVEFGDFDFDGFLIFEKDAGSANFGAIRQGFGTSVDLAGTFTVSAANGVTFQNSGNDFTEIAIENGSFAFINDVNELVATELESSTTQINAGGAVSLSNVDIATGSFFFVSTTAGDINIDAAGDLVVNGVTASNGSVNIEAAGDLVVNSARAFNGTTNNINISAGGDLDLGTITTSGDITISALGNLDLGTFAAAVSNLSISTSGDLSLSDLGLSVGGDLRLATSGSLVIDSTPSGSGSYHFIADDITISTDIIGDQLLLEAENGVSLGDAFFIDVTDLLLRGSGNFEFATLASNVIDNLAADIDGNLELTNSVDLNIGNLTFSSNCGDVLIKGVSVTGDLSVVTSFSADIQQAVDSNLVVGGHTLLDVSGGNICLIGGDCNGDGSTDNDFNTLEIVNAGNAEVRDANDLTVTSATATN